MKEKQSMNILKHTARAQKSERLPSLRGALAPLRRRGARLLPLLLLSMGLGLSACGGGQTPQKRIEGQTSTVKDVLAEGMQESSQESQPVAETTKESYSSTEGSDMEPEGSAPSVAPEDTSSETELPAKEGEEALSETGTSEEAASNEAASEEAASEEAASEEAASNESASPKAAKAYLPSQVDVDLTRLSSTMVYSEVYTMMISPDNYLGKTIRMRGTATSFQDPNTGVTYHACIIKDATACCAQGIEFLLAGEAPVYPAPGDVITVTGVFELYNEGENIYCRLGEAVLES